MPAETAALDVRQQDKAKVFISYSRKDMAFAGRLETVLKERGFEPLIDRTEIYAFEDWWKRIEGLIAQADTVVFVLSPDSVTSEVALKEVAFAASLNKRFAPVVCRRVDDKAVPEALAKLNFIFFDDAARFNDSAGRLADALSTDIGWIRMHTELGEAGRRWTAANRPGGLLLRSPLLEEAERWIAARPGNAPAPTEDTQAFIRVSRQGATRRRNILTGSLTGGLVLALGLAGLAYWQRGAAVEQRNRAERTLTAATETANALVTDLAVRLRDAKGVPASLVKDILDRARKLQDQLIGAGETSSELRRSLSRALNETATTLFTLGDSAGALALAKQAEAILQDLLAAEPGNADWRRALAASKSRIADALQKLGKTDEALTIYGESLTILQALIAKDASNTQWQSQLAGVYDSIGDLHESRGSADVALTSFQESLAINKMLFSKEPNNKDWQRALANDYGSIASLLQETGRLAEALNFSLERLAIAKALAAQDPDDVLGQWALYNARILMGNVFKAQGKYAESLAAYLESRRIMEPLAKADPDDAQRQNALRDSAERAGEVLFIQRKFDEALAMYRETSAIAKALAAKEPTNTQRQRNSAVASALIGDVLRQQGKLDDALAAYLEAKTIFGALARQDPNYANWQQSLAFVSYRIGDLLTQQRKLEESVAAYKDCIALTSALLAKEPNRTSRKRDLALCHSRMGVSLRTQRRPEEALEHLNEARSLYAAIAAIDRDNNGWQRDLSVAGDHIGSALDDLNRFEQALAAYQESFQLTKVLVARGPNNSLWQRDLVLIINRLANTLLNLSRPEEALKYYEEPAQFSADDVTRFWNRGRAALYGGNAAAAADDLAALVKHRPANIYNILWLHIARQRAGQDDREEWQANAAKADRNRWPWPIVAFYSGSESAESVMAAAKAGPADGVQSRVCDVEFHTGLDKLAKGDLTAARVLLEAAVQDCDKGDFPHPAAMMELRRLDGLRTSQNK